jgi:foldase protein PrsA
VSKVSRLIPALGAVFFALIALAACGGSGTSGIPGDAVANVGGTTIPLSAVKHWIGVASISSASGTLGVKPTPPEPPNYTGCIAHLKEVAEKEKKSITPSAAKTQCETQYKSLLREVMGFLLTSQWVIGEANELGVHVSDAEVHKQFVKIADTQFTKPGEFEKFMTSSGQTASDLLLRVKLNLLSAKIQQKIVKAKTNVTEAQIEKYYKENKSRFGQQEKRTVSILRTATEAQAKAAKKEIESGKSFASVAKKVSTDPTSSKQGGLIIELPKGEEEEPLNADLFAAPAKQLSAVVHTPFGYYIYEVKTIFPGSQQTLAQAKASIRSQLQQTGQQGALSTFVKSFKKKWLAKSDCATGYIVTDCKQYKGPKTAKGTAG